MPKPVLTIVVLLALVAVTGCGSGSSTEATESKPFKLSYKNPPIRPEEKIRLAPSGLAGSEPKPIIPNSPPPEELAIADLIEGVGDYPVVGQQVTIQYVGYGYDSGKKFASSWEKGRPVTFTVGAGEVIPGWEEGIQGSEVGDRRELVIPPDQAKGPYPRGIPKGEAVVFVVEPLPARAAAKAEKPGDSNPKQDSSAQPATNKTKPKVTVPKGPPPKKLVVKDLQAGTGPAAQAGDEVTVQYVGVDYKTGKQFDASWDRGEPFSFTLGGGEVIKGWDQGIEGMKAGGRRELIIPPGLAYGSQQVGSIAPNSTLVFVVDLLETD